MEEHVKEIKLAIDSNNEQEIIHKLDGYVKWLNKKQVPDLCVFKTLLVFDSTKVLIAVLEQISELSKEDEPRATFTDESLIETLLKLLLSDSEEVIGATVKALCNICYENKKAADLVDKAGIDYVLTALRDDSKRADGSLTTNVSKLLINIINSNENLPTSALKAGVLPIIERLLVQYKKSIEDNKTLMIWLLGILNTLTEYLNDKEYVLTDTLIETVIEISKSEIAEICVLCLEIFHPLAEKDEIKTALAKEGICELLFALIEKNRDKVNDEDSRSVLKMACDLIVIILTGDDCMEMLYDEGKAITYHNMLKWLDSEDEDLLSTGILAIGNFARKDTHCIQMVENGLAKKLIDLLRKYNKSTDIRDCKVQHALLSTLKNLLIPKENKSKVLKDDIIEVLYPMLKQDRFMVVFKLLGTFRMLIDGQPDAAYYLLCRKDFIERLTYWCYNSEHLGVRGEVPRIFSWLIKNSPSSDPFSEFVSVKDSVKCIVEMIASNHAVMQNESFFALSVLAVGLEKKGSETDLSKFYDALCDANVGKILNFSLNKYAPKWDSHTIDNNLTFLAQIIKSSKVIEELKSNGVIPLLKQLDGKVVTDDHKLTALLESLEK